MFKEVQKNLMWEASWASNVYYIPQILLTILWVVLFIFIQIPAGMVELLFWWLMFFFPYRVLFSQGGR